MTNGRLELAENWQNNNASASDAYLALHNESFDRANLVNVADQSAVGDRTPKAQPAPAGDEPTTKSGKMLMDAVATFTKATDPALGLKDSQAKFEGAIKQADTDFAPTMQALEADAKKLMPDYQKAEAAIQAADNKFQTSFQQVPETEQTRVESMLQTWAQLDPNNQVRQAINKELAQYPGLIQSAEGMEKAANAPAITQMESLKAKAQTALQDRVNSRVLFSEALKAAGRNAEAEQQIRDAAKIMGIDVPAHKASGNGLLEA